MWVVTGDHDDRVVPSHSFKYVAELQWKAGKYPNQNPIFLEVVPNQGHGSEVSKAEWLALIAFVTKTPIKWDTKLQVNRTEDGLIKRFNTTTSGGGLDKYVLSHAKKEQKKQEDEYNTLISSLQFKHKMV